MAPTFVTGRDLNISYMPNNYEIYGNQAAGSKRELEYNFPKIAAFDSKSI